MMSGRTILVIGSRDCSDGRTVAQVLDPASTEASDGVRLLIGDAPAAGEHVLIWADRHGVPVEVVTVGDAALVEELRPLVAATREAVVNAAKHSGAPRVDVYSEVAGRDVEVFVRDRGRGFDLATVPGDRLGVRNSIIDRMERHGGTARIRTAPGEGTEVKLEMTT